MRSLPTGRWGGGLPAERGRRRRHLEGGGAAGGGKGEVDAAEVARLQTLVDELQQRLAEAKAAPLGAPFDARGLVD